MSGKTDYLTALTLENSKTGQIGTLFIDPTDNHLKFQLPSGSLIDLTTSGAFDDLATTPPGGAPVTIDTGYIPAVGHVGKVDGGYSATDPVGTLSHSGNLAVLVSNYAGVPAIAGSVVGGSIGDAALVAAAPLTFDAGGVGGALRVIVHPFAAYPNAIRWLVSFSVTEN